MIKEIIRPEVVEKEAMSLVTQANAIVISDNASYKTAMDMLPKIKVARKVVKNVFGSVADQAYKAWKAAKDVYNKFEAPLVEAETRLKNDGGKWQYEQQQKADEERRVLEARKEEREEERQKKLAKELAKSGQKELAKAVLEQPIVVAPIEVKSEPPKVEGVSFRENWKAEVIDLKALAKYVLSNPSMINLLLPNMPALNSMAKGMKANMSIPGVKVVSERVVSSRTQGI